MEKREIISGFELVKYLIKNKFIKGACGGFHPYDLYIEGYGDNFTSDMEPFMEVLEPMLNRKFVKRLCVSDIPVYIDTIVKLKGKDIFVKRVYTMEEELSEEEYLKGKKGKNYLRRETDLFDLSAWNSEFGEKEYMVVIGEDRFISFSAL